jgi:hypothetical protein
MSMTESELFDKLRDVKTMPELDALRLDVVTVMTEAGKRGGENAFKNVQNEFIRAKNRLQRIPLRDRTW